MSETRPTAIHLSGILLFLFIPLVLFLFLRFPFGILPSFIAAILIMFSHRFVAIPFMNRYHDRRCLWCGRTSRARETMTVQTGTPIDFECCLESCAGRAKRFLDFCVSNKNVLRAGIFLPLTWYVISMLLYGFNIIHFAIEWNRFIFQFFIACTVVTISILYITGREAESLSFPFPIHNLFLLGIKNTLLVFRLVGIWWIAVSLLFLYRQFH